MARSHVLIHEQLGNSKEGVVYVTNATFDEAKSALKKIVGPHAFLENEQWSVIPMKEEFHAEFVAIVQILHQIERLSYFSNMNVINLT